MCNRYRVEGCWFLWAGAGGCGDRRGDLALLRRHDDDTRDQGGAQHQWNDGVTHLRPLHARRLSGRERADRESRGENQA